MQCSLSSRIRRDTYNSGRPFRIDRRPDPRVPLDGPTSGCTPVDTFATAGPRDLKKSMCILTLKVGGEITIESLIHMYNYQKRPAILSIHTTNVQLLFPRMDNHHDCRAPERCLDRMWGTVAAKERQRCTWGKVFKKARSSPAAKWSGVIYQQLRHIVLKDPVTGGNTLIVPSTHGTILEALKSLINVDVLPRLTATDISRAFFVHLIYSHIVRDLEGQLESLFRDMTGCVDTLEVVGLMIEPSFECEDPSHFIITLLIVHARPSRYYNTFILPCPRTGICCGG